MKRIKRIKRTICAAVTALELGTSAVLVALPVLGWQNNLARGMANDEAIANALGAAVEIVRGWCNAR